MIMHLASLGRKFIRIVFGLIQLIRSMRPKLDD